MFNFADIGGAGDSPRPPAGRQNAEIKHHSWCFIPGLNRGEREQASQFLLAESKDGDAAAANR